MFLLLLCFTISNIVVASPTPPTSTSTNNLYSTLGVSKSASQDEIKKGYRKAALKHHPDKVPESERSKAEHKFKEIAKAYEWLSDDQKRKLYDRYGERSLDPNFQPGMFDGATGGAAGGGGEGTQTFNFGNGGFPGGGGSGLGGMFGGMPQHDGSSSGGGDFAHVDLNEILRQMMGGVTGMDPSGGNNAAGGGFGDPFGGGARQYQSRQHQQQQQPRRYKEYTKPVYCSLEDLSKGCTKKLKVTYPSAGEKIYNIQIKAGWKDGTKIKFNASRAANPNIEYPPITFIVHEKKHPFLKHVGNNLIWKCKLSPSQAVKGARLRLPLPDGSTLEIESKKGTKSGDKMRVPGRGMPLIKTNGLKGDVVIDFIVAHD